MIFNCINKRIKSLVIKKSTMAINNTNSDSSDTNRIDRVGKDLMVFSYIRSISNKITNYSINKSTNMIGYRCLNKLNKFKFIKTKINRKKIISYTNCNNCDVSYVD